jgi:uncharacterized protein
LKEAQVAELVDALVSNTSGVKPVPVRLRSWAHLNQIIHTQIHTIDGHPMAVDLFLPEMPGSQKLSISVYCHGFKGFKNWGFIPHIHEFLVTENRAFLSFDHSHNGVFRRDFDRLDLFSENTIGLELRDMESIAQWIQEVASKEYHIDPEKIDWIGHSRGGANVWVFASLFPQYVRKLVTWAAIDSYELLFKNFDLERWKIQGLVTVENSRTKQEMPLKYSLYQEFVDHEDEYNVIHAAQKNDKSALIIHGENDPTVPLDCALRLAEACQHAILMTVPNQDHTFGISHPMTSLADATTDFWMVLDNTLEFLEEEAEDHII